MNLTSSASDYNYAAGHVPHTDKMLGPIVQQYVREFKAAKVLDIGCGTGTMASSLAQQGLTVVGLDPSSSGIDDARKNSPGSTFYCLGIYDDPAKIAETDFDLAICTEVVEHVFYPKELPRFARAKLKTGGILLVSTPYHGWLKNVAISVLGQWDKHHTVFWDGGHIKFWSRATLTKLLEDEGFEVIGFHGCGRGPYLWESMVLAARKKA